MLNITDQPTKKKTSYLEQVKSIFKNRPVLTILFALIFLILISVLCCWFYVIAKWPEPEIYFKTGFNRSLAGWKNIDAQWLEQYEKRQGILKLNRKKYMTPYAMKTLSLEQTPSETHVLHFAVRVNSFTEDAITLATLYYPTGPLAIIVNKDSHLGFSDDLFAQPEYKNSPRDYLLKDKWQDIYVYINNEEKNITLYLGPQKILTRTWESPTYPVQEIWLGAVWYKGSGNYGSPINIAYDRVTLGNKGIIPKPNIFNFIRNVFY